MFSALLCRDQCYFVVLYLHISTIYIYLHYLPYVSICPDDKGGEVGSVRKALEHTMPLVECQSSLPTQLSWVGQGTILEEKLAHWLLHGVGFEDLLFSKFQRHFDAANVAPGTAFQNRCVSLSTDSTGLDRLLQTCEASQESAICHTSAYSHHLQVAQVASHLKTENQSTYCVHIKWYHSVGSMVQGHDLTRITREKGWKRFLLDDLVRQLGSIITYATLKHKTRTFSFQETSMMPALKLYLLPSWRMWPHVTT